MAKQFKQKINQVEPKRRSPRAVIYLKLESKIPVADMANLHDNGVPHLAKRWGRDIFTNQNALIGAHTLLALQPDGKTPDEVRDVMRQTPGAIEILERKTVLLFRDTLRKAWSGDPSAVETISSLGQCTAKLVPAQNGQLELVPEELLGITSILFLRALAAKRLGMCVNRDCLDPYFTRARSTQRFCDAPVCMVESHRASSIRCWRRKRDGL